MDLHERVRLFLHMTGRLPSFTDLMLPQDEWIKKPSLKRETPEPLVWPDVAAYLEKWYAK